MLWMDFAMIGSAGAYVRYMKLSWKWEQKKESGSYTQKQDEVQSEHEFYQQQLDELQKENDPEKQAVYAKLYSGKQLSSEELEYLRKNDPAGYLKAKEIEAERTRAKKEMEECKTKEDVERVRTVRLSVRMAYVNSISNNPNIPASKKMELLMHENAKTKASEEVIRKFKESLSYSQLPTDAEKLEEEKQAKEAAVSQPEEKEGPSSTEGESGSVPGDAIQAAKEEPKSSAGQPKIREEEAAEEGKEAFRAAEQGILSYGRQSYLEIQKQATAPSRTKGRQRA